MDTIQATHVIEAIAALKDYDFGRPSDALAEVDRCVAAAARQPEIRTALERELPKALGPGYSLAARQFACEKLNAVGGDGCARPVAELLAESDPRLVEAGCTAIGVRPSAAADRAVQEALGRATGASLGALIRLAAERRDPGSVPALVRLVSGKEPTMAEAAIAALGRIATPDAVSALMRSASIHRAASEDALLEAGQELHARGWTARSRQVLTQLREKAGSAPVRRGAAALLADLKPEEDVFQPLFNGRDLTEFVVDTPGLWTVRHGVIIGKSAGLPYNDFLRTRASYANFTLRAHIRLIDGYGNSGIQFRSKPAPVPHEVEGYQADAGERYWGALYDESRRRKILAGPPESFLSAFDPAAWHSYTITAAGNRIRIVVDGVATVDYEEREPGIDATGFIALQVHAAKQPLEARFANLRIQIL